MLLRSRPDTVHGFLLRKTQVSTSLIRGCFTAIRPRLGITLAVADCEYRAPLSPRLRGCFNYTGFAQICQVLCLQSGYSPPVKHCCSQLSVKVSLWKKGLLTTADSDAVPAPVLPWNGDARVFLPSDNDCAHGCGKPHADACFRRVYV